MIRIELDEAALGAARIAMSPLRDAFCAAHLQLSWRTPSGPYQAWVGHAREVWREDDRLRPLRDLFAEGRYEVSDFLLTRPLGTSDVYEEPAGCGPPTRPSSASRPPSATAARPKSRFCGLT